MRILVSCIPYDGGRSGISEYVREVVRELRVQGHELTLLCEPDGGEQGTGQVDCSDGDLAVATGKACRVVRAPRWTRRPVFSMLWHLAFLPIWIRRHRREFDGFFICAANRRVCAFYPLPTVATIHDLANFHIPGKYSRLRMFYLAHVLPRYAKRAQHLVAVSGATKSDMVRFWHCAPDDVTVLYNGLSGNGERGSQVTGNTGHRTEESFEPVRINSSDGDLAVGEWNGERGLGKLLYISRIEHPGKNHVRLIEAYSRLPRALAEAHPLVLAGADWKDADVVREAARQSQHADLIRFTGFVPAAEMPRLWAEAGYYVFPSLFEGFGLSLVEAMARGIPCACSNNGSLGEIAGDVAVTFDPESADAIADALVRLLGEGDAERKARVARGLEHVKKFSWSDHARGVAGLIAAK